MEPLAPPAAGAGGVGGGRGGPAPEGRDGLAGLKDAPRPGRRLVHGPEVRARLVALACTRPPETPSGLRRERWTHAELAEAGGMSESQAHAIPRSLEVKP